MTLINYLTRVHFADGVLEEALFSELERNQKKRPLVITDHIDLGDENGERFFAGLPADISLEFFRSVPAIPTEEAANAVAHLYCATERDHLIAFGLGSAIDLAKIARIAIAHDQPLGFFADAEGGSQRVNKILPDLYVVPTIVGFGSAVSAESHLILETEQRVLVESAQLIPTVAICDPTLTLNAAPAEIASVAASAIAQCLEAFLSRGFNPPADGIALEGLRRGAKNLKTAMTKGDLASRREVMAASLNAALAMQKGLGATYAIGNALYAVSSQTLDGGAVSRLLLPEVLRFNADSAVEKCEPLGHMLGFSCAGSFADGLADLLHELPLPNSLSEMGIGDAQIQAASELAAHDRATANSPRFARAEDILLIMRSVH
ncbi:MAG: iron-containing alcohol dehydrogenase [Pseudomonadota bacterium]